MKTTFKVILAIMIMICIVLGIDTLLYFNYHQTEGDCGQYQTYLRQTIIVGNSGNCVDNVIKTEECLNYDGELCIEWIEVYRLEKKLNEVADERRLWS